MKSLYSKDYRLEFYHIPKNGMTSVINSTKVEWVEASTIHTDRKVFCVLRNPIERTVSSFLQIRSHYLRNNSTFKIREISKTSFNKIFLNTNIESGFLEYLNEIKVNGYFDSHNLPQYYYLTNKHKEIFGKNWINDRSIDLVDHFLNLETLDKELAQLFKFKELNKLVNKKKLNVEKSRFKNRLLVLANTNVKKIRDLYEVDFKLYEDHISTEFDLHIKSKTSYKSSLMFDNLKSHLFSRVIYFLSSRKNVLKHHE